MEDIKLLKKQYKAVKKQRDDLRYFLTDLIDAIHSGAYNHFDIRDDKVADKDGNKVTMFDGIDAYTKALHHAHYFHIARLLEKLKEYKVDIESQPYKAELSVLLENWKLPKEIEKWKDLCKQEKLENLTDTQKKEALKRLATMLIIFSQEYDFSHDYPGADRGVYSDAFVAIVRQAMQLADILATPEGIEKAIEEMYDVDK